MNGFRGHFVTLSILLVSLFTSCDKEWIHIFDKVEYRSFITNGCDQSVTISQASDKTAGANTISIAAGEVKEVADTYRWELHVKTLPTDTVFFTFADGSRMWHAYELKDEMITFTPKENNIFDTETNGSWIELHIYGRKYRYDYRISGPVI